MRERSVRRLALWMAGLAFAVVVLGAWVRLTGAGLGCPDWPGCYGRMVVGPEGTSLAASIGGGKAWREMVHRYAAGMLGIGILVLTVTAVRNRRQMAEGGSVALAIVLLGLVVFQAALGAWTVTLRLQPAVVVAHLLGGMAVLGLLWRIHLGAPPSSDAPPPPAWLRPAMAVGVMILAVQIGLGGWTSANYAALACPDFPTCHGDWWPAGNYAAGFRLWQESRSGFEGGVLAGDARIAIHFMHRIGALVTVVYLGVLCGAGLRWGGPNRRRLMAATRSALVLLGIQAVLGVSNVWLQLPLGVAVAHNAGAALLLLALITMHHRSGRRS